MSKLIYHAEHRRIGDVVVGVCGANILAAAVSDDSGVINCRRCLKVIAEMTFPARFVTHARVDPDSLVGEIVRRKQAAAAEADDRVQHYKRMFDERVADARTVFERALEEFDREIARHEPFGGSPYGKGAVDVSLAVNRNIGYIVNNLRIDTLVEYGRRLEDAVAVVHARVEAEDQAEQARSLAGPDTTDGLVNVPHGAGAGSGRAVRR